MVKENTGGVRTSLDGQLSKFAESSVRVCIRKSMHEFQRTISPHIHLFLLVEK